MKIRLQYFVFALPLFLYCSGGGGSSGSGSGSSGGAPPAPTLSYTGSPFLFYNTQAITAVVPTVVGTPFSSCSAAPPLPAGLTLNISNCTLSGTPTATSTSTAYTITAANQTGSTTASITITVSANLVPTVSISGSPFNFIQSTAISTITPTLGGGVVTGCSSTPTLPTGLAIDNTTCAISGTPTASQTATAYAITATNAIGSSTAANINITVAHAAPTNFAAAGGNQANTLTWDAVGGATSYNIYWGTSTGVTTASTKIAGANSPYVHSGLTNGTTYYYVVTVIVSAVESAISTEINSFPYKVQVPLQTGLTTCWDATTNPIACAGTGQDGESLKGLARSYTGPTLSGASDYTTTDNTTGLIWKSCSEGLSGATCATGTATTYKRDNGGTDDAAAACTALNGGPGYASRTDWRLPSVDELQTLTNYNTTNSAINATAFPATVATYYWSSTTSASSATNSWYVYFYSGSVGNIAKTNAYSVRCVASGPYTKTVGPYTDNSDGTILDKSTNLVWQKCSKGQNALDCSGTADNSTNWLAAISYCQGLSLASKTWRLPDTNELNSLVARNKATAPFVNTTAFPATVASNYWSSSAVPTFASAWYGDFSTGYIDLNSKPATQYVRCVAN